MGKRALFLVVGLLIGTGLLMPHLASAATGTINSSSKYSQFYNLDLDSNSVNDLINWKPTNGTAVQVTDTAITGTIWGETVGWINLGPFDPAAGPDAGVKNNCSGQLSGYAWGQTAGWINFAPTHATIPASIDTTTGNITGQVWAQNFGWITLNSSQAGFTGLNTTWHGCDDGGTSGGGSTGPTGPTGPTAPPQPDICNNIPGIQTIVPPGYYLSADGNCYQTGQDMCPNLVGVQAVVPNGYHLDGNGNCVLPAIDMCPNIVGTQAAIPNGYVIDTSGNCVVPPISCPTGGCPTQQDMCSNLPGVQATIPSGYYSDGAGNCVMPSQDMCPNMSGVQSSVPSGYQIDNNGNCIAVTQFCSDTTAVNYGDQLPCVYNQPNTNPNPEPPKPEFIKKIPPIVPMTIGIVGLLTSLPSLAGRFGSMLLTLVFYRRKRPWGVVFDSETKEPLDPAYVSVIDTATDNEVFNQITDIDGRFGFFLKQGTYKIVVNKTNYLFPSKKLAGQMKDNVYDNLYFGETFSVVGNEKIITLNVPMDRLATDWNQEAKEKQKVLHYFTRNHALVDAILNLLFVGGFVASVVITYLSPVWWNFLMLGLYILIIILQSLGLGAIKSGRVTKAGQPLQHAIVRVYSASLNHEIAHRVTDEEGRYYVLVPRSDVYVTIETKNPDGTYTKLFTSPTFHAGKGMISESYDL
jgi:hypothetical protein